MVYNTTSKAYEITHQAAQLNQLATGSIIVISANDIFDGAYYVTANTSGKITVKPTTPNIPTTGSVSFSVGDKISIDGFKLNEDSCNKRTTSAKNMTYGTSGCPIQEASSFYVKVMVPTCPKNSTCAPYIKPVQSF
jgi:hypothetical protein